jgi:cyclopropane fatty-acyl-phospholipid synthase-like methyltransferase
MDFYEDEETAEQYIEMAKGYDGRALIAQLDKVLQPGATVLELGMGPGVDLDILAQCYKATGTDTSSYFVARYKTANPDADVCVLDAVS